MKKVLVAIIAMAMLVSMFAVVSHGADYMGKCFDGAFLTNNDAAATHVPTAEEKDVKTAAEAGDLGNIYGLGYSYIHFQGWLTDNDEFTDIGYQINGGEIVWGVGAYDAAIIGLTGGTYALRFNFNVALAEGEVTFKFVEKLANGEAKEAHTIVYFNAPADPNVKQFASTAIVDTGNGAIGTWVQSGKETACVEFTTAAAFNKIGLGIYWASNPVVGNGPKAEWRFDLYKFEYNAEYTLSKAPVKTKSVTSDGDNNPAFSFDLEEEMPAGTYIAVFTITNPEYTESLQAANETEPKDKKPYLVLPKIDNPSEENFKYVNDPFNIVLNAEVIEGSIFVANPADTDAPAEPGTEPETVPQTGDFSVAMFAVIAVLAMGAAVVFMKKKAF
ncbi:MAG: LPXTG cell wall anchor domain-containing protein [Clostridia bacterium]|nr:LPXTG cell wall anchor domain-containing protein [Clostridia bacterium]